METPDVNHAVSSSAEVPQGATATLQSPETIDLSAMSREERQQWRTTGELPKKAESATAKKSETSSGEEGESESASAESRKAAPASEAGKHQEKRSNAETRLSEILSDLKRAGLSPAELKTFKREAQQAIKPAPETKAEPSPAAKTETAKAAEPKEPVEPNIDLYDGSEGKTAADYDKAMKQYARDCAKYEAAKARQEARDEFQREQSARENAKRFEQKLDEAKSRYQDFDVQKIDETSGKIMADEKMPNSLKAMIGRSEVLPDLMYVLSGDAAKLNELLNLSHSDPMQAMKYITRMEILIEEELAKGKSEKKAAAKTEAEENPEGDEAAKTAPAPKTKVPPPPGESQARGTSVEDPGVAAARAGDFRSAKANWTQQYAARHK